MSGAIRHVAVRGRVQGVGYRAWVVQQAKANGLEGWVRNRRDGGVEALFSGPAEIVANMVTLCGRGPVYAHVDAVQDEPGNPDMLNLRQAGERFSVLPTL